MGATVSQTEDAPRGRFVGQVLNAASNEPVPGAELVFSHAGAAETVGADPRGRFRFEPSSIGSYQLAAVSAEGFFSYAPQWQQSPISLVARRGLQVEGIVVYLAPALRYQGRVVRQGGEAIAGARIRVSESREAVLSGEEESLLSDSEGRFVFNAREFSVVHAQFEEEEGEALVDEDVQISKKLEIVLGTDLAGRFHAGEANMLREEGDASLRGNVVSSEGPVPAFNVMLTRTSGLAKVTVAQKAIFDGQGEFEF